MILHVCKYFLFEIQMEFFCHINILSVWLLHLFSLIISNLLLHSALQHEYWYNKNELLYFCFMLLSQQISLASVPDLTFLLWVVLNKSEWGVS